MRFFFSPALQRRKGTTFVEVVLSAVIFSLAAVMILRVWTATNQKNADVREYAALQAAATRVAEQMQLDLLRGDDIYIQNYDSEGEYICHVYMTEDYAYEHPIYYVDMTIKRETGHIRLNTNFVLCVASRHTA